MIPLPKAKPGLNLSYASYKNAVSQSFFEMKLWSCNLATYCSSLSCRFWKYLKLWSIPRLSSQYQKSLGEVNETFQFYVSMLEERKAEIARELEQAYSSKQVALSVYSQKAQETVDKIFQVIPFNLYQLSVMQREFV